MGFGGKGTNHNPARGTPEEWWDKCGRGSPSWGKPPMEKALGVWNAAVPGRNCGSRAGNLSGERFRGGEALAAPPVQELLPNYLCDCPRCCSAPHLIRSNPNRREEPSGGGAGSDPPGRSKSRQITGVWSPGRAQLLVQTLAEGLELSWGGFGVPVPPGWGWRGCAVRGGPWWGPKLESAPSFP